MPDLEFQIEGVEPVPYAASPQLAFTLRIRTTAEGELPPEPIHSVMLHCQVRLEPARRRYEPQEQERLHEIFGEPHRWGQTVRSTLWTNTTTLVPGFTGQTQIDLIVHCTFDFNVSATKYFAALEAGEVPLSFLFNGTIFYASESEGLQIAPISWEREAAFRLPVQVWRQMMDLYYPNTAWLCLRKDIFDRLAQYKRDRAMPTWEQAVESLLNQVDTPLTDEVSP